MRKQNIIKSNLELDFLTLKLLYSLVIFYYDLLFIYLSFLYRPIPPPRGSEKYLKAFQDDDEDLDLTIMKGERHLTIDEVDVSALTADESHPQYP